MPRRYRRRATVIATPIRAHYQSPTRACLTPSTREASQFSPLRGLVETVGDNVNGLLAYAVTSPTGNVFSLRFSITVIDAARRWRSGRPEAEVQP